MIHIIFISILILTIVLISAFAMYLPLLVFSKDKELALRYAIPYSLSIEIMFGYIYYCTSTMIYFPICYLIFVILMNIWAYRKLALIVHYKTKINWLVVAALLITIITIIYTRYFDSFTFFGPGNNDTYNHLIFVKNLFSPGYLRNGYYAPGFHIVIMPIAKFVSFHDLYRFTGPAIGIMTIVSLVFLLKDYLKNKILILLLLGLLCLPIYNQFILQTISFFSSALTFIYFGSYIVLLSDNNINNRKINVFLFIIFSIALALTVPYLFVTLFPAFLIVLLIVSLFKKKFDRKYLHYIFILNLILIMGFLASFGHVYLQSKVLKRYSGFPGIQVAFGEDVTTNDELANRLHLPGFIKNNAFLKPMIGTGYDIFRVKNIRPASSILGLGAYFWILLSLLILLYAIRKKNSIILVVAVMSVFFGLCTQTGMFEMSFYRGRSGWYLMMLSILGLVLFIDQIYSKKMHRLLLVICAGLLIAGIVAPPKFYRPYYDEEYNVVGQIAKQHSDKDITLIVSDYQLGAVAENITTQQFAPDFLQNINPVLIIEKKMFRPDPILSQAAISTDSNFKVFNEQMEIRKDKLINNLRRIESNENFPKYNKYFENDDFIIYENLDNN